MGLLDRIQDSFKYLDKNGLGKFMTLIKQYMDGDRHWTGTHAEYEVVKDTIPAYTILHFTDDYDNNLGMPIKDVSSAAGMGSMTIDNRNMTTFLKNMLEDIKMQEWENGSYAGKFQSTCAGGGDFGSWIGTYQCTKNHSGAYGTTMIGTANNIAFTAMWGGSTDGWLVKMAGVTTILSDKTKFVSINCRTNESETRSLLSITALDTYSNSDPTRNGFSIDFWADHIDVFHIQNGATASVRSVNLS